MEVEPFPGADPGAGPYEGSVNAGPKGTYVRRESNPQHPASRAGSSTRLGYERSRVRMSRCLRTAASSAGQATGGSSSDATRASYTSAGNTVTVSVDSASLVITSLASWLEPPPGVEPGLPPYKGRVAAVRGGVVDAPGLEPGTASLCL